MNSEQEKARLLQLHRAAMQAHLEKDAGTWLAPYGSEWYDVRATGIRLLTKEEELPAIEEYLRRTHFADIREITPPIIHLSTDASMAWMIAEIRVQATQEVAHEEERDHSLRATWVAIYEKHEGEWAQVVDAPFFQFQTTDEESGSEENRQAVES